MKDTPMNSFLISGSISGMAGLLVFLTIHHFWIKPIWFILPPGLLIAIVGGLAVGWAYSEIQPGLPARPWTAVALFAIISAILLPAIIIAQLRPAPLNIVTGAVLYGRSGSTVFLQVVLELLVTASLVGGIIGWWLGQTPRAALSTALAGLIFAIGPGHNIPLLGNTPAVGKGLILLVMIILVSALVLVESQAWLTRSP